MRWSQVLLVGLVAVGCASRDDDVRRERLRIERQALLMQLEQLEDRLVADQARVRFWREIRERHQSVSALACANLESHVESMALLARRQEEKRAIHAKQVARRLPAAP